MDLLRTAGYMVMWSVGFIAVWSVTSPVMVQIEDALAGAN